MEKFRRKSGDQATDSTLIGRAFGLDIQFHSKETECQELLFLSFFHQKAEHSDKIVEK